MRSYWVLALVLILLLGISSVTAASDWKEKCEKKNQGMPFDGLCELLGLIDGLQAALDGISDEIGLIHTALSSAESRILALEGEVHTIVKIQPGQCPSGQYAIGVDQEGNIICAPVCLSNLPNYCQGIGCVNFLSDANNCGACGVSCDSGTCSNGICSEPSCQDARKNGQETDVDCGGNCPPCANGRSCACDADCQSGVCGGNGICAPSPCIPEICDGIDNDCDGLVDEGCGQQCDQPFTHCEGRCVDLQSNGENCGRCGNICPREYICLNGQCQLPCLPPFSICGGSCRDLRSDRSNCGGCGNQCPDGTVCINGVCRCDWFKIDCGNGCEDSLFNDLNCGRCGEICPPGTKCGWGSCQVCPTGDQDYDRDGRIDCFDNCPAMYNPDQGDSDGDTIGDPCDAYPYDHTRW